VCVVFFFAVFLETGAWHCHRQHRQHPPNSQVLDSTALFNDFPDEPENSSVFAKQSREWVSCFEKFIDSGRGLPNWISVPRKFMCSWLKLRNCERESRLNNVVKKRKTCKTSWRPRMCIAGVGVAPPQVVYQDTYLNICICHGGRGSSRGIGSRTGVPHGGCVINSPWLNLVSSNLGQKQKPDPLLVTPENRRIDLISQNPRLWQLSIEATKQIATPLRPQRHNQFGLSLFPVAAGL